MSDKPITVLLIEDNAGDARPIREMLAEVRSLRCKLEYADNLSTGLARDLFFLDLKMPRLNGVQTLRELRKINTDVPIYIITVFHEEYFADLKKIRDDGIEFEVLRKPIESEDLVRIVKGILESPASY